MAGLHFTITTIQMIHFGKKTYKMKTFKSYYNIILAIASTFSLITISSCNSEDFPAQNEEQISKEIGINAIAKAKEFQTTRSVLSFGSRGMDFAWDSNDELTVFAKGDNQSTNNYKLSSGGGSTTATFTADYFSLKKGIRYYALSFSEHTACDGTKIPDQNNITLDYSGQIQKGNASTSHLGKYDYMSASTICEEENNAHFAFTHLGLTLRLVMWPDTDGKETAEATTIKEAFKDTEFTEIEIYDSEDAFRQPQRSYSFETGTSADNSSFSFVWPEQTITSTERFKLQLQNATDNTTGIKPTDAYHDGTTNTYGDLTAYIELPPNDFTGKTIGFIVRGKKGSENVTYYGNYQGFAMENDKAYQLNIKLKQTTDYTVTLKVNHMWQHGNTTDNSAKTRATGDPGYDDKIFLPTNIYYIFCVGEEVRAVNENAVNSITSISESKWSTTADEVISTYADKLTFTTTDADKDKSKHLYVVASTKDLSSSFSSVSTTDSEKKKESYVRSLVYSIEDASTSYTALDGTQTFLRDLYSTPWDTEATFPGNLKDPMQDVILYHTAAKVDLKWNASTALSTENKISANSVNSTNLSLFTPTNNSASSKTNGYTVSASITTGTQYNGRQVFYLPQFNTYNVTIGTNTQDVQFSPSTANGFTSWLRWLKTY